MVAWMLQHILYVTCNKKWQKKCGTWSYDLVVHNRQGTDISIPPFAQRDERIIFTTHDGNEHTCTCECFGVWVKFSSPLAPHFLLVLVHIM